METAKYPSLADCTLCPRECGTDRTQGKVGICRATDKVKVAKVMLHQWEEPCLTGNTGAGTVFFSYCNLRCAFCQNHSISHEGYGIEIDDKRLAEIFLEQQARGAATLDLVTPTHYVPQIMHALDLAKEQGFTLPVVYNCGGYESLETVKALKGYVDIFMPDLKYASDKSSKRYSRAPDYFETACRAIRAMYEVTGPFKADDHGMLSGVLVRHMVMPGGRAESFKILDFLWNTFHDDIYLSLMNQYLPMYKAAEFPEINRRVYKAEYNAVIEHALDLGFTNCFIQEGRTALSKFIPEFDGEWVLTGSKND